MCCACMQSLATHTRLWYHVDAEGQVVGRLAAMLSLLLQGKKKPIYHPAGEARYDNCMCGPPEIKIMLPLPALPPSLNIEFISTLRFAVTLALDQKFCF